MNKSVFEISKMDCPSEENLIKLKLDGLPNIINLRFDIPNRTLTITHTGAITSIEQAIHELNLDARRISTETSNFESVHGSPSEQKQILWTVLAINFGFFLIESFTGLLSHSMGLVADSLDMLADAVVYGMSLFAVGQSVVRKKRVARLAGYFQLVLAILGFLEVVRRFVEKGKLPNFQTMIIVSTCALLSNGVCLYLLNRSSGKDEAHMRASMIFTSNDIIINLGVIIAGVLVMWSNSGIPDLLIGSIVFMIVIRGSIRILALGK